MFGNFCQFRFSAFLGFMLLLCNEDGFNVGGGLNCTKYTTY